MSSNINSNERNISASSTSNVSETSANKDINSISSNTSSSTPTPESTINIFNYESSDNKIIHSLNSTISSSPNYLGLKIEQLFPIKSQWLSQNDLCHELDLYAASHNFVLRTGSSGKIVCNRN